MTTLYLIVGLVAVQRLGELAYARRNERNLLARGGREVGADHYPLFIFLHGGWLVSILLLVPRDTQPNWMLIGVMLILQIFRVWVVSTLGPYWTTRVITLPGAPLIRNGPFRYVRHPNYLVVIAEIAVLPLAFGAVGIAVTFSILNLLLLGWRIQVEERALTPRRAL